MISVEQREERAPKISKTVISKVKLREKALKFYKIHTTLVVFRYWGRYEFFNQLMTFNQKQLTTIFLKYCRLDF